MGYSFSVPDEMWNRENVIWGYEELYHPLFHQQNASIKQMHLLEFNGYEIKAIVDRNFCSHLDYLYRGGKVIEGNKNHERYRRVAGLMCVINCCNIRLEPNIAMYELADSLRKPAEIAEFLTGFRQMDDQPLDSYLDLFSGRKNHMKIKVNNIAKATLSQGYDLIHSKLKNFNFNLNFIKKIKILRHKHASNLQAFMEFADWQANEFLVGTPALVFALLYFSPGARKDMLKPEFKGIRNACWDLTAAQTWLEQWRDKKEKEHYLFISFDKQLQLIVKHSIGMLYASDDSEVELEYYGRIENLIRRLWGKSNKNVDILLSKFISTQKSVHRLDRNEVIKGRDFNKIRGQLNKELLSLGLL